jgi:hypothetical protein
MEGMDFDRKLMAVTVIDSENLKWQSQLRQFAVGRLSPRLEKENSASSVESGNDPLHETNVSR